MPKKEHKADELALDGLAAKLEKQKEIRKRLLKTGRLLVWEEPKKVGIINFKSMRPNASVLTILLHHYLHPAPELRTINVFAARREAEIALMREDLEMPADPAKVVCDASSLRCFVTYMIKRHNGAKRRDPVVRKLFDVMNHYFQVQPMPGDVADDGEEGEEEECKEEDVEVDPETGGEADGFYRDFVPADEMLAGDADPDDQELYDMLSGALVAAPGTGLRQNAIEAKDKIESKGAIETKDVIESKDEIESKGAIESNGAIETKDATKGEDTIETKDATKGEDTIKAKDEIKAEVTSKAECGMQVVIDLEAEAPPPPPLRKIKNFRLERLDQLRQEIEKRRRTLACARPSTAKLEAVPLLDMETQPMDLEPVARDLTKQFQAVAADESPDAKVVGEPDSQSRPEPEFVCDAKTVVSSDAAQGDLFHLSDSGLSRKDQFEAKAKSASKGGVSGPEKKPNPEDAPAETGEVPSLGAEQSAPKRKRAAEEGESSTGDDQQEAKQEAVTKPKASAKTKAKASAKTKAKASAKSKVKAPAEDEGVAPSEPAAEASDQKEPEEGAEGKKTFASRPCPTREAFAKQRWTCIRDSFELYVANHLRFRSKAEDAYWKHCLEALSEEIKVLLGMSRLPAGLRVYAKYGFYSSVVNLPLPEPGEPAEASMRHGWYDLSEKYIRVLTNLDFICLVMCLMKLAILEELDFYDVLDFFAGKARTYPAKFAAQVVRGRRHLLAENPTIRAPLQYSGLLEFLNSIAIGDNWNDAELWCPLTYVYGSKHLHLPPELKQELKQEIADQAEPLSEATLDELNDDELQILFWAQATAGDASGLKAVKPEVCHEEPTTETAGVPRCTSYSSTYTPSFLTKHSGTYTPSFLTKHSGTYARSFLTKRSGTYTPSFFSKPCQHNCGSCFWCNPEAEAASDCYTHASAKAKLSAEAVKQRMRRIFTPRADGSYLVAADFVKQWADKSPGGGRDRLMGLFEKTSYHREQFLKRCKAIAEEVEEESFEIEGEFLTLEDMDNLNFSESKKAGIVAYCSSRPSLVRQSKYGEGEMYWTDVRIKGKLSILIYTVVKTKRKIYQEMMDWEEDASSKNDVLDKHKFDNWGLSNPDSGAFKELLDVEPEDAKASDGQLAVDQGSVAKKVSWPELAKDASPSSLLHPCMKCIQRHEKKIDTLLQRFSNVDPATLTPLQQQLKAKLNKVQGDLTASVDSIETKIKEGLTRCSRQLKMNKDIKVCGVMLMLKLLVLRVVDALLLHDRVKREPECHAPAETSESACPKGNRSMHFVFHKESNLSIQVVLMAWMVTGAIVRKGKKVSTVDDTSSESDVLLEHLAETMGDGVLSSGPPKVNANAKSAFVIAAISHSPFLLYGLAGWQSKSHPEVAEAMYKLLASDLHELFHTGVEVPGRGLVYGAVIACKGDMDWHKKVMNLTRHAELMSLMVQTIEEERARLEQVKEAQKRDRLKGAWQLLVKHVLLDLYVEQRYGSAGPS
ncbi:unnamed protein product [Symbiodinium sp. CCMP2592]|nr:unnamed protein product [Symbiodinium sp. CCMP2592]